METKNMNYFIATIVAMVHKNLFAALVVSGVLLAGTMVVLTVTAYGLSLEPPFSFSYSDVLIVSIMSLVVVGVLVSYPVLIFKAEKALPTSRQNSLDFKIDITIFILTVVVTSVLLWFFVLPTVF